MKKLTLAFLFYLLLVSPAGLLSLDSEQMDILFRSGENFYRQGEYKEAIKKFQEVLELSPENSFAQQYIKKAEEKLRLEPFLKKKKSKEEEVWQRQDEINKIFREAEAFYQQAKYKESIRKLQEVLIRYPDHAIALEQIRRAERKMRLDKITKKRRNRMERFWQKQDAQEIERQERQKLGEEKYKASIKERQEKEIIRKAQKEAIEKLKAGQKEELARANKMKNIIAAEIRQAEEQARLIQQETGEVSNLTEEKFKKEQRELKLRQEKFRKLTEKKSKTPSPKTN